MKYYLILLLLLLFAPAIHSQNEQVKTLKKGTINTDNEKAILNNKPYQRRQWYLERRKNLDGSVPNIMKKNREALLTYKKKHPENYRSTHGSWSSLGPYTTTGGGNQGRVNSIDIHPTDDNIIYVCTSNGGIWKTINGGTSWTSLTDHLGILAFTDLEIDQNNPNIIYALSGDGDPVPTPQDFHTSSEVGTAGIFKSTNGGLNWTVLPYEFPQHTVGTELLVHPTNSDIQFITTSNGIYRTDDEWTSAETRIGGFMYDIVFKPTDPFIMYASSDKKIYRGTWTGDIWEEITDVDFAPLATSSRIQLAVTPDFPSYIAALGGNREDGSKGVYTSLLGLDDTWTAEDTVTDIINGQADYNMALLIDPNNYNKFYAGGIRPWKSTNEGKVGTWTNIYNGQVHADVHDIALRNGTLYYATDGGIIKSTDDGASWTDISIGLAITEIYRIAGTEDNSELFLIGTQDNGTQRRQSGSTFTRRIFGDGMHCLIDHSNPDKMYATKEKAEFVERSTDGGETFNAIIVPGQQGAWITPLIMDPSNPAILFMGKGSVHRSNDSGDTWQYIGSPAGGALRLNTLAQGTSNGNRMYATHKGRLFRSDNALASPGINVNWAEFSTNLPGHFITGIAVDPSNSLRIFITFGNYTDGMKVYESLNGGVDWENISGSLPNVPALSIAYHGDGSGLDRLYIGTDIGVFYRDDNIGDWIYYSNFLPAVPVEDLFINKSNGTIVAGTYGRGLWRSNLISNCSNDQYFASGVTHKGQVHFTYNNIITSLAKVSPDTGTEVFYTSGFATNLMPGFRAPVNSKINIKIGGCPY